MLPFLPLAIASATSVFHSFLGECCMYLDLRHVDVAN